MKYLISTLIILSCSLSLSAQRAPNTFPVDNTPEDSDALYTQEAVSGTPTARKFTLPVLKAYFRKATPSALTIPSVVPVTAQVIYLDASAGTFTVTLPAASTSTGNTYKFVKTDSSSNAARIAASGTTMRGSSLLVLMGQWTELELTSNGTIYR